MSLMRHLTGRIVCLTLVAIMGLYAATSAAQTTQSETDQAAIRKMVEDMLAAAIGKHLDALAAGWAPNSPGVEWMKEWVERVSSSAENPEVINVTLTLEYRKRKGQPPLGIRAELDQCKDQAAGDGQNPLGCTIA